ncbi:hypothetical protein CQ011_13955 [Arthrobacter sp. MYb213]|nr:hypothetical protein CQ011_13955 [Arthrobacter sp. MYb213]
MTVASVTVKLLGNKTKVHWVGMAARPGSALLTVHAEAGGHKRQGTHLMEVSPLGSWRFAL